ncbi:B12-binding domain-containing radical SAM protein [Mycobacterium sp. ML4]
MTTLLVNPPGARQGGRSFVNAVKLGDPRQYCSLPMEHLGIMSIKAHAAAQGLHITTVDGLADGHSSQEETWLAMQRSVASSGRPQLVGFSCIDNFGEVLWLAQRAKQAWAGVPVVIGNVMATLNHERILRQHDCFDFVIVGDGEVAFTDLAMAVANDAAVGDIPGLARRDDTGRIVYSPSRLVDLDTLPWPARDSLPTVLGNGFAAAVFTTRGCPYRCSFCGTGAVSAMFGKDSYRTKSIDSVVDEIEYLVSDFGIGFVCITDDLFVTKHPGSQQRAADFASAILARGIKIDFMLDARLDSVVDLGLFKHLHRAGLRRVFIGLETGSYEQLRAYRKQTMTRGADPVETMGALQDVGIEIIPGSIMFHPTVQPDELRETARLLRVTKYGLARKLMSRIVPYPGTPLYEEYSAAGYLTSEWPLGEWEFVDPEATRTYAETVAHIDGPVRPTFDEAESHLLSRLGEWGDVLAGRAAATAGRVPAGASCRSR